jgi:hypothetical protein
MRIKIILSIFIVTLSIPVYFLTKEYLSASQSGAPPYDLGDPDPAEEDSYSWIDDWKRPDEPVTVL